ncbi:MAG: hypothetical protein QXJ31_03105 [Candidatus Bathyarchaeia archaeon]
MRPTYKVVVSTGGCVGPVVEAIGVKAEINNTIATITTGIFPFNFPSHPIIREDLHSTQHFHVGFPSARGEAEAPSNIV